MIKLNIKRCVCIGFLGALLQVQGTETVDIVFVGGQSNATADFRNGVNTALSNSGVFSNLQVVHINHPGLWLRSWYNDSGPRSYFDIDFYNPEGTGVLEVAWQAVLASGKQPRLAGFFWFQGEGDSGSYDDQATYVHRFNQMLGLLQTNFSQAAPPNFAVAVVDYDPELYDMENSTRTPEMWEGIRSKLIELGAQENGVSVDTRGAVRYDGVHLTASERTRIGREMGKAFVQKFYQKIYISPATSVLGDSAVLNGQWIIPATTTGVFCNIDAFWGETDGGTNANAWESTAFVGTYKNDITPAFSHSATGLNQGTTYHYAFRATIGTRQLWTVPGGRFTTLGPPTVDNASGASAVSGTVARLSGRLSQGGVANAWICWGDNDGGTASTGDWDNVVAIGAVSQAADFTKLVTGLSMNNTYFYRCYTTNAFGSDWSSAATFSGTPAGAWTPADLMPAAWYDASETSSLTIDPANAEAGNQISQWADQSGNNRNVSRTTGSSQPKTGSRTINGLNVIDYDGGDSLVASSANLNCANLSVFVVRQWDNLTTSGDKSFNFYDTVTNPSKQLNEESTGSSLKVGMDTELQTVSVGTSLDAGILSYVKTGTNSQKAWLNGTSNGTNTNAASVFTANLIYVGSQINGAVGEMIVVDSALTDADRQKIEGYLAHKWGLVTNLPLGHPYKSAPPSGGSGAITNFAPTGISPSAATLNASVVATGTDYDVTVYYGTVDGGTNAASWASSAAVGSWENVAATNISHAVSGLTAGQTYYYTFMASNSSGVVWASPSWTFKTLVTSSGFEAFADWAATGGGGGGGEITFNGDSSSDGIVDGMGWMLGSPNPNDNANPLLPQSGVSGGDLSLSFKMLKSTQRGSAVLFVQYSSDLGITDPWTNHSIQVPDASGTVSGVEFVITPIDGTDNNQVQVIIPASAAGGGGKVFARLQGMLEP